MKKRAVYIILASLLVVVNGYIIAHRNEGYKYYPYRSYSELYVMDSSLYIEKVQVLKDSFVALLANEPGASEYKLFTDEAPASINVIVHNRAIAFPLVKGCHKYTLHPAKTGERPIAFTIDHIGAGTGITENELLNCNLPGPDITATALNDWKATNTLYTNEEIKSGVHWLTENTRFFYANTDEERVMEIVKFVNAIPNDLHGQRPEALENGNGWLQISAAFKEPIHLNCGNYSKIFLYLCAIAKMPVRIVSYFGPNGAWSYGQHYFNEVYLRDAQQWVVVDAVQNIYLPRNRNRFLNAADIKSIVALNSYAQMSAYVNEGDSLVMLHGDSLEKRCEYYNSSNADLVYYYPEKSTLQGRLGFIANFYSFNESNAFYSVLKRNNWQKIALKIICFYSLLLLLARWGYVEIKHLKHTRKFTINT